MIKDEQIQKLIGTIGNLVNLCRGSNCEFAVILSGLYADLLHFIFELMQNHEYEVGNKVKFSLYEGILGFYYNREIVDFHEVKDIAAIAIEKERENEVLILKFGIGFNYKFTITAIVYIFPRKYNIKKDNFVIHILIDNSTTYNRTVTLIQISF